MVSAIFSYHDDRTLLGGEGGGEDKKKTKKEAKNLRLRHQKPPPLWSEAPDGWPGQSVSQSASQPAKRKKGKEKER